MRNPTVNGDTVTFDTPWPDGVDPSALDDPSNGATVTTAGNGGTVNFNTLPIKGDTWSITVDGTEVICQIGGLVNNLKIDTVEKAATYLAGEIDAMDAYTASVEPTTYAVAVTKTSGHLTLHAVAGHRYSYSYAPVNPNYRVLEAEQVDTLSVFNTNSPADDVGTLTGDRLYGLGLGPDTVIGDREIPGGITYRNLESLNVNLGFGNDTFTIETTHVGSTSVHSGGGIDTINVKTIAGHTTIETGTGGDTVTVSSDLGIVDQIGGLLTIAGSGGADVVNVRDANNTTDTTVTLTGSTLTGLDMPMVGEIQRIYVQAESGTYILHAEGYGDVEVTYGMEDPVDLERSLNSLFGSTQGVQVRESREVDNGELTAIAYTILFVDDLAGQDLPQIIGTATSTVTLGGTPASGQVWKVTVDGIEKSHTVSAGETLAQIASQLAEKLSTIGGCSAAANGARIVIRKSAGGVPKVNVIAPGAGTATIVNSLQTRRDAAAAIRSQTLRYGASTPEIQEVYVPAQVGQTYTLQAAGYGSVPLSYGMTVAQVAEKLNDLFDATTDVAVTEDREVAQGQTLAITYTVTFGGLLAGKDMPTLEECPGDNCLVPQGPGLVDTRTVAAATAPPHRGTVQTLTVSPGASGEYRVGLRGLDAKDPTAVSWVVLTAEARGDDEWQPLSADDMREAFSALLDPNNGDDAKPWTRNVAVERFDNGPSGSVYQITFQGQWKDLSIRSEDFDTRGLADSVRLATRNTGINYYGLGTLNIDLGSGHDIFNVQGTSAGTNLNTGAGDDRGYVSSAAHVDATWGTAGFVASMTGDLDGVFGALDVDAGPGVNLLMVSDVGSRNGDGAVEVTGSLSRS